MITVPELAAEALSSFLASHMNRRFGSMQAGLIERISSVARLALDCIGNSDALYHTVEHTMLVTLVGYDIMNGRALLRPTHPSDYAHLIAACLFHDIGYVRGILNGDEISGYIVDANGGKARLPRGSSDAALLPYHVDRSKLYVLDRLAGSDLLDAQRIAGAIEFTRFPPAASDDPNNKEGLLVRAANLIGQLGDPHYLRKINALWYEFDEVGMNKQLGYTSPADLINLYPQFYWRSISHTFRRRSAISTSRRAGGNGLHASIATSSAPSATSPSARTRKVMDARVAAGGVRRYHRDCTKVWAQRRPRPPAASVRLPGPRYRRGYRRGPPTARDFRAVSIRTGRGSSGSDTDR